MAQGIFKTVQLEWDWRLEWCECVHTIHSLHKSIDTLIALKEQYYNHFVCNRQIAFC